MYSSIAVANAILDIMPRAPMGLNKLVYQVHGWSLALGVDVLAEQPEVWRHGPVYVPLYHAALPYGHDLVRGPLGGPAAPRIREHDHAALSVVAEVVARWGGITDENLSTLAHSNDSPWMTVARRNGFRVARGTVVPADLMRSHFQDTLSRLPRQPRPVPRKPERSLVDRLLPWRRAA